MAAMLILKYLLDIKPSRHTKLHKKVFFHWKYLTGYILPFISFNNDRIYLFILQHETGMNFMLIFDEIIGIYLFDVSVLLD